MTQTVVERFTAGVVFDTLPSASTIEWLLERHGYEKRTEFNMKASERFFSPDYFTARRRFRETAERAHGRLETIPIKAKGPNGEDLGIDIVWLGSANPRRVLLHSSGLHGVEGFAGSAIQSQLLDDPPTLPEDAALIVVHVINPYGMAWLRRFNENNVDLNRNFLGDEKYEGAPQAYSVLNSFLNPESPPSFDLYGLRAAWLILKHGIPALKEAVVGGQYEYPRGLFFGGRRLEHGSERYQAFLSERLASVRRLVVIDVHTGIGKYGEDMLIVQPERSATLREMFGERVALPDPEKTDAYSVRGGLDTVYGRVLPHAEIFAVTQEFGTYSPQKVVHALREENRSHHYGAGAPTHSTKQILKTTFCPEDEGWRESVLSRGKELLKQGVSHL